MAKTRENTVCAAHPVLPFGCIKEREGYAVFEEKPTLDEWVSCGWYVLKRRELLDMLPEKGSIEYDIFPKLKLRIHKHTGFWATANSPKDITEFEKLEIPQVLR